MWVLRIFILLVAMLMLSSCGDKVGTSHTIQTTLWGIVCTRKWFTILFMTIIIVVSNIIASNGTWVPFSYSVEIVHNIYDKIGNLVGSIGTGEYSRETDMEWNFKPAMFGGAILFSAIVSLWLGDVIKFPFLNIEWGADISDVSFWRLLGAVLIFCLLSYIPSLLLGAILWGIPYLGNIIRYIMTTVLTVFLVFLLFTPAEYKGEIRRVHEEKKTEASVSDIKGEKNSSKVENITKKADTDSSSTVERIWSWTKDKTSDISSFAKDEFNDVTTSIDEKIDKKKEQRAQKKATAKNSEDRIEKDNDSIGIIQKVSLWFRQLSQKQDQ